MNSMDIEIHVAFDNINNYYNLFQGSFKVILLREKLLFCFTLFVVVVLSNQNKSRFAF